MSDPRRVTCRSCGKKVAEAGDISWNGFCESCSNEKAAAAALQMAAHRGPVFEKWRRNMAASVGGVILDDTASGA